MLPPCLHRGRPRCGLASATRPSSTGSSPGASAPSRHPAVITGRNQLAGTILEVTVEGLLAKIVLAVGQQRLTAIITADAVRELSLQPGDQALALIKSTEVMIGKP